MRGLTVLTPRVLAIPFLTRYPLSPRYTGANSRDFEHVACIHSHTSLLGMPQHDVRRFPILESHTVSSRHEDHSA